MENGIFVVKNWDILHDKNLFSETKKKKCGHYNFESDCLEYLYFIVHTTSYPNEVNEYNKFDFDKKLDFVKKCSLTSGS